MNAITTKHNLNFEWAPWDDEYSKFRIGTCEGLYGYDRDKSSKPISLDILAVQNTNHGNGHFEDVMQWFEFSAKRDNIPLRVIEIYNARFFIHLIEKRGFAPQLFANQVNVIKDCNNPLPAITMAKAERDHANEVMKKIASVIELVHHISFTDIPGDDDKVPDWAEKEAEKAFW